MTKKAKATTKNWSYYPTAGLQIQSVFLTNCRWPWNSSQAGFLPGNSARRDPSQRTPPTRDPSRGNPPNGILSKAGFLPKRDSSRNGIPPKTGFLPKQEFSARSPVWEESQSGGILVGRSSVGRIIWEESFMGGIPMEPQLSLTENWNSSWNSGLCVFFLVLVFCFLLKSRNRWNREILFYGNLGS